MLARGHGIAATSLPQRDATSEPRPPLGEEIANSTSHGIGLLAASVAGPFLIAHAVAQGKPWGVVGASVFLGAILAMYASSTLYHALLPGKAKRVFRRLEYCAIFLLIAGTYTPVTLVAIRGAWGWSLFGVVWSLAGAGMLLKTLTTTKYAWLPGLLYLALAWLIVIASVPLSQSVPFTGLMWLVAGGIAYTVGMGFFAARRVPYCHFVWHLFVMAGTSCHFVAVWLYIV